MRVCVLQPDYSTSQVDYQYYDPPRDLTALLPGDTVDHVQLNKLHTYSQLRALRRKGYDIFVNLCEGYLDWAVPSIDVIHTLELLNLPYTGPNPRLYDPPKELMKYVAYTEGVATPAYVVVRSEADLAAAPAFPLFVKPAKAGDSLGVDERSLVRDREALESKVRELLEDYDEVMVEQYIDGREFTVLVAAGVHGQGVASLETPAARTFTPVEFIFPGDAHFKTYALKTSELHPEANIPCNDPVLEATLRKASARIFEAFGGVGYARLDFRVRGHEVFFLEINFTCSVFYTQGYEGSADYILKFDGAGQKGFLGHIIAEGIARHRNRQKKYEVKGSPIAGYGIYAARPIGEGESIFDGEDRAQRIVTRRFVGDHWSPDRQEVFRHYAYPISREVFILWDKDPAAWAPQNHSCAPNTAYRGLDVYALRPIARGEELTLDYATMMDETLEPFVCHCGAPGCRGTVQGVAGNNVTDRESKLDAPCPD
ncbi:MAG TPA: SET domain-containing protein-lysine N-methyltransferase [Dinghuibacter sp.]|uniref:SET domain-containing protein-lysine N-methyltransferase n=1 Tax=Dinghuibacter sp. TaxID=2024697 RepID=UPI002B9A3BBF|nr:SET domain-containing protein-lysine N-methyltransferase [Dinghuibacter sp.]HTJ14306.1 SET domain-containing protein-lysine N-methyltransferase [Dinghuibacter sp.]